MSWHHECCEKRKKREKVLCSPLVSPDQDRDKEWKHGFLLQLYEDIRRKRLSGIAQIISPQVLMVVMKWHGKYFREHLLVKIVFFRALPKIKITLITINTLINIIFIGITWFCNTPFPQSFQSSQLFKSCWTIWLPFTTFGSNNIEC